MRNRSIQKYIFSLTIINLTIILFCHFTIILLHAGALNPISVKFKPFVDSYVKYFFQQNWHLFAPDPITSNYKINIRVRYVDSIDSKLKESDWYDIMTPMIKKNDQTIISPYNRVVRIGMGYIQRLNLGGNDELTYKLLEKKQKTKGDLTEIEDSFNEQGYEAENAIYRLASSYAKKVFPNDELLSVQFMTTTSEAIPYSKRNNKNFKSEIDSFIFEWKEVSTDVVKFP